MDGQAALKLIREIGVSGLGGYDGCICTSFKVQGVCVDVSCRKSSGGVSKIDPKFYGAVVRVYSRHVDASGDDLVAVAREVARQVHEEYPVVWVRFTDYRHDAEQICVYCSKPREHAEGYLCDACITRKDDWHDEPIGAARAWMIENDIKLIEP